MKSTRQNIILQIISEQEIETQNQLMDVLAQHGVSSTQATLSRDIKELHLIKEPAGQGKYRYAVSAHRTKLNFADKLRTIFRESVLTVDNAQNIVVIKTLPGLANAAGSAVDGRAVSGGVPGRRRHGSADHAGHGKRRGFYGRNQGNAALTARKSRRTAEGYADAAIAPH